MSVTVHLIPPQQCRYVWKDVKGFLKPAITLSRDRWKKEYVLVGLALGEQSLWVVQNEKHRVIGAMTTEVVNYPEKKMVALHFMGGEDFDDWYGDLLDAISEWAQKMGCAGLECIGRPGFWKWFKQDGFRRAAVFYERPL